MFAKKRNGARISDAVKQLFFAVLFKAFFLRLFPRKLAEFTQQLFLFFGKVGWSYDVYGNELVAAAAAS